MQALASLATQHPAPNTAAWVSRMSCHPSASHRLTGPSRPHGFTKTPPLLHPEAIFPVLSIHMTPTVSMRAWTPSSVCSALVNQGTMRSYWRRAVALTRSTGHAVMPFRILYMRAPSLTSILRKGMHTCVPRPGYVHGHNASKCRWCRILCSENVRCHVDRMLAVYPILWCASFSFFSKCIPCSPPTAP